MSFISVGWKTDINGQFKKIIMQAIKSKMYFSNCFFEDIFILLYIMKIIFDIPYIINKEYFYIKGYTIEQSHGGADVSHERRSIFVKDEDTGKVFEITVFSEYIDENDFLEVEFLPHTKYGAIISREKSRWLG